MSDSCSSCNDAVLSRVAIEMAVKSRNVAKQQGEAVLAMMAQAVEIAKQPAVDGQGHVDVRA